MSGGSRTGSRFIRDLKRRNDVCGSDTGKRASERVDGDEYALKIQTIPAGIPAAGKRFAGWKFGAGAN
jgi:hypothetical protein